MSRMKSPARRTVLLDEIVGNLTAFRSGASPEHVAEGRVWYREMGEMIAAIAAECAEITGDHVPHETACAIFASMSQNTNWADNVSRARKFLSGGMADGRGHLRRVMAECADIDANGDTDLGIKRNAFKRNLSGDESEHCSDRWALRAAFDLGQYDPEMPETFPKMVSRQRSKNPDGTYSPWAMNVPLTPAVQALVQEAAEIVAAANGETVAQCQAVIWCAIRGTGK